MKYASPPYGWTYTDLQSIAKWGAGGTPSRKNSSYYQGSIPWIKTGDLGSRFLKETSECISEEGLRNSSAKIFPKGSVAIAMYGATIGKTSILGIDAATNQACAVGIPEDNMSAKFLYYLLNNEKNSFVNKGKGGAQPNISQGIIKSHKVAVPPLDEQTRIANKLDELFAQVDTIKARVDTIPGILKRFRQSVLAAAVSGRLTEEWRSGNGDVDSGASLEKKILENRKKRWRGKRKYKEAVAVEVNPFTTLPDSWVLTSLDSIVDASRPICYGILMPKENLSDGVLYVKVRDMKGEVINLSGLQRTSYDIASKYERSSLVEGDLLIAIRGTYGRVVEVPKELEGGNITQDSARISVCDFVDPKYVMYLLRSIPLQKYFQSVARGVAVKGVNIGDLRPAPVLLPPYEEQVEIVREIEVFFSLAQAIERQVLDGQVHVNSLTQSILAKAFRGELVPQDPGDEPANVLLERIQGGRERKMVQEIAKD